MAEKLGTYHTLQATGYDGIIELQVFSGSMSLSGIVEASTIELRASDDLIVASGTYIDADGRGEASQSGDGAGSGPNWIYSTGYNYRYTITQRRWGSGSGGGHGGDGADSKFLQTTDTTYFDGYPTGGSAHGSAVHPWTFGSGGGGYCNQHWNGDGCPVTTTGGSGGGRIKLVAGSVLTPPTAPQ